MPKYFTFELRVRNIIELVINVDHYLKFYEIFDTNLKTYVTQTMVFDRKWAEGWDLFGLCSILNCNIRSVYPNVDGVSKDDNPSKRLLNVTFQPRETIATNTILIMWSKGVSPEDWLLYSDQEYWSPNHYVPLLKPRLQATYAVAKAVVEIKQKKEPNTDTKTTFGTMVLQGIRNVVPVGKKKNSRIKKCNATNKRGITFNVRNLIKVININYLNEESLKDDVGQAVLERSLKWALRTAYATQIKALFARQENMLNKINFTIPRKSAANIPQIVSARKSQILQRSVHSATLFIAQEVSITDGLSNGLNSLFDELQNRA
ncbi:unnamed protein product [Didymodactylos carnosus]|uniref:Uncharacterized protein n=1 Tax=Didymodactylos carnosus TaxID=1234261 RepID=A0A815GQ32_9BILA|nr:unnamed protein product [Didymodactylos carnosus]CAF4206220.1 unnamed protein product [Didymodactylos carnosus]